MDGIWVLTDIRFVHFLFNFPLFFQSFSERKKKQKKIKTTCQPYYAGMLSYDSIYMFSVCSCKIQHGWHGWHMGSEWDTLRSFLCRFSCWFFETFWTSSNKSEMHTTSVEARSSLLKKWFFLGLFFFFFFCVCVCVCVCTNKVIAVSHSFIHIKIISTLPVLEARTHTFNNHRYFDFISILTSFNVWA